VSPIFVRPVREQLEHDRLIRFLSAKYKKKFDVAVNLGDEQAAPLKIGQNTFYPDLLLTANRKLAGVVEVESGESVNNLEAMAQWVPFSRARAPFHLYVPAAAFDVARRLCDANQVKAAEIWTYRALAEGFDLVRGFHDPNAVAAANALQKAAASGVAKSAKKPMTVAKAGPAKKPAVKSPPKATKAAAKVRKAKTTGNKTSGKKSGSGKARKPVKIASKSKKR
jgi:hypothetical protein